MQCASALHMQRVLLLGMPLSLGQEPVVSLLADALTMVLVAMLMVAVEMRLLVTTPVVRGVLAWQLVSALHMQVAMQMAAVVMWLLATTPLQVVLAMHMVSARCWQVVLWLSGARCHQGARSRHRGQPL